MPNPEAVKYICIHGHFYQPPRENPWLDEVEREPSAAPYHDWNTRINYECYRANTAARLADGENYVLEMFNNYKHLSFNIGPTLLNWLERCAPGVHQAILDADRESCRRLKGHGNAMAQVYNHIIMPLANRRDKVTQVRWGIRDFEWRFGRKPEGMWLAETAVDLETLGVLAEEGIRFTVLSPFQAARWRFTDFDNPWQDARDAKIPTGRAYKCRLSGGRSISLFFYDPMLARGLAFERLLEHSSKLLGSIDSAYRNRPTSPSGPWLVHTATDGESYGHHFKFGDMALAAAVKELLKDPDCRIINYATFLDAFPVRAEVEIVENTAWSCSHGVGRWKSDCGCNIGSDPKWNQKWRGPLREAMDDLRDLLAAHYEKEMGKLGADPWETRNDYIEVLLEPQKRQSFFIEAHTRRKLGAAERIRFLQLLEMQKCTMAMFTSCGWFFDEVSEIEAVLIMRYAARAMQLAEKTGAASPEAAFLEILEKAPSNRPEYCNAANVYAKKVKPQVVEQDRVAANHALQSFLGPERTPSRCYAFTVSPLQQDDLGSSPIPCRYGRVLVRDERTFEEGDYLYALLHFGGLDFRCSVKPYENDGTYERILQALQEAVAEQNTVRIVRILDEELGASFFGLQEIFQDKRTEIALKITDERMRIFTDFQRHMHQGFRPFMKSLKRWGIDPPDDMKMIARRVLSDETRHIVNAILERGETPPAHSGRAAGTGDDVDFFHRAHMGRLRSVLEEAQGWGITLDIADAAQDLGKTMRDCISTLIQEFTPQGAGEFLRLVDVCRTLRVKTEVWELQTSYYTLVCKGVKDSRMAVQLLYNDRIFLKQMDDFLGCRFARMLAELPGIFC